jgi:hypothetical protein
MVVKPWQSDAQNIKFVSGSTPFQNQEITEFLSGNLSSTKKVLVGPKGFGKTLLLRFFCQSLRERSDKSVLFFPTGQSDIEYLDIPFDPNEMWIQLPQIKNAEEWSRIWESALLAVAYRVVEPLEKFQIKQLDELFPIRIPPKVADYLNNILTQPEGRKYLLKKGLKELRIAFGAANRDVVIFFDNADEVFRFDFGMSTTGSARLSNTENLARGVTEQDPYIYDFAQDRMDVWVDFQVGLLLAIRMIERQNKKLHVFTSLRSEALNNHRSPLQGQAIDQCVYLKYTPQELEEIFYQNIALEEPDNLVDPDAKDPLDRFLGLRKIPHRYVKTPAGSLHQENIFQFLLRHSLFSPRDLSIFGKTLASIPKLVRKSYDTAIPAIRNAVNRIASNELFNSWKQNAVPRWEKRYDLALQAIGSNVLTRAELAEIDHIASAPDKKQDKSYTFSFFMYQHGLLGYSKPDLKEKGTFEQEFLLSWDQRFLIGLGRIPDAEYYFLHPLLVDVIRRDRADFRPNEQNTIGYRERFSPEQRVPNFIISINQGFLTFLYKKTVLFSSDDPTKPQLKLLCLVYSVATYRRKIINFSEFKNIHGRLTEKLKSKKVESDVLVSGENSHLNSEIRRLLGYPDKAVKVGSQSIVINFCDPNDIFIDHDARLAEDR